MTQAKHITSAENEKYHWFSRLYRRKYRDREDLYVIEGQKLIREAVKNGAVPDSVFVREDYDPEELPAGAGEEVPVYILSRSLFDKVADTETPQGIAAVCRKPRWTEEAFFEGLGSLIVLDRLQDPGNLGTIIRTADAAGFRGILVMKGTADLFSPKTVRAAAGSLYRVRLLFADGPEEAAALVRAHGMRLICTSPYAQKLFYDADMAEGAALVIGNEANGVCHAFLELSDMNVRLPMEGSIESLNAAVAASVVMYEALRQRHMK